MLRLTGGRSVPDHNELKVILRDELLELLRGLTLLVVRWRRIGHSDLQKLTRVVHGCKLTACTIGRVYTKHALPLDWSLQ
ncbi:hypothetical protein D1872_261150 [compost metagenome]